MGHVELNDQMHCRLVTQKEGEMREGDMFVWNARPGSMSSTLYNAMFRYYYLCAGLTSK
jgi:hypothetical protein